MYAAANTQPQPISVAESELMRREPDKSASQAAHIAFQFELMQVRQANPVALAYPFSKGTTILSSHQIPADIPRPTGLPSWMAPLAVWYFRAPTGSFMDADRDLSKSQVVTIGATSFVTESSSSGAVPAPPKDATEFQDMGERLLLFALETGRWSPDTGDLVRVHMRLVQELLKTYPISDVIIYDENVRFNRHRFGNNSAWATRDEVVFEQAIRSPAEKRAALRPPPTQPRSRRA